MSDQFPSLGVVIRRHRIERCSVSSASEAHQWGRCVGCDFESYTFPIKGINWDVLALEISADHIAEVWREACTVATVEQLDALPVQTVVREILIMPSGQDVGYVWERWNGFEPTWVQMGYPTLEGRPSSSIRLPARVIHNPDWETK